MPDGYLVSLGANETLDADDGIGGAWTFFTTAQSLGSGQWAFTGTDGATFFNETETGEYFLATNGNVYFVPDLGEVDTLVSAQAVTVPFYSELNIVQGTQGDDLIDASYTDVNGNTINGSPGNADLVYGGSGNDDIRGGGGNDVLYGDGEGPRTESLNWFAEATDGDSLASGFTQTTGDMDVAVSFTNDGNNNPTFVLNTDDDTYTEGSEPFSDHSSLFLTGNGGGDTSTTTIDFSANAAADVTDNVENVSFRLNDLDFSAGNHRDIVTVNAFDAAGNPVTVTFTPNGTNTDTVSGNTVTTDNSTETESDATGSVLVDRGIA